MSIMKIIHLFSQSAQIKQMEDVKISKKSKVGILTFVTGFEEFAELAETIFRNAERRGDLDKAYVKLIRAVFMNGDTKSHNSSLTASSWCVKRGDGEYLLSYWFLSQVEKVANESQKTPRDVVMMENFHHIFSTLSRLKISCLEAERREAKHKYTEHLQSYVINSLGQPLEKLNVSLCCYHDHICSLCDVGTRVLVKGSIPNAYLLHP